MLCLKKIVCFVLQISAAGRGRAGGRGGGHRGGWQGGSGPSRR